MTHGSRNSLRYTVALLVLFAACDTQETPSTQESSTDEELLERAPPKSFRSLHPEMISHVYVGDRERPFASCADCEYAIVHDRGPTPQGVFVDDEQFLSNATVIRNEDHYLSVDDRAVAPTTDGAFHDVHVQALTLLPLLEHLEEARKQREAEARILGEAFQNPKAVLFADPEQSWRNTTIIVHTAAQAGFRIGFAYPRPEDLTDLELICRVADPDGPLYEGGHASEGRSSIYLCRTSSPDLPDLIDPITVTLWEIGALQEIAGPRRADENLLVAVNTEGITMVSEIGNDRVELPTDDPGATATAWRQDHPEGQLTFAATGELPTGELQAILDTLLFDDGTPRFPYVILGLHQ